MSLGKGGLAALVLGLTLALLAPGVSGEEPGAASVEEEVVTVPSEEPEKLPTIEVVAPVEPGPTGTVITQEDMALGPYENLPGHLEAQAGIDLTRNSLLGEKNRMLNIRGFDESRYQVYMNGRSVKGVGVYGGYFVDWSTLALVGIENLEIIRGASSAEYGNTLGGLVKLTTVKGSKKPKLSLGGCPVAQWDVSGFAPRARCYRRRTGAKWGLTAQKKGVIAVITPNYA
jgi:outer membrane receptor for ferrienterochelin and colicin